MINVFKTVLLYQLAWFASAELSEVFHLTAEPDFKDVTLRWEYDRHSSILRGFQVHYCELQAWGPVRCRTKTVEDSAGHEVIAANARYTAYSVVIGSLRMATNYSFKVRPIDKMSWDNGDDSRDSKLISKSIVVPTKGFSARATQCLPHASEVEVMTGPNFAGRIAVEATEEEKCTVDGDPNSSRDTYILHIDHKLCGTHMNETTVATFIIVQESLPILTHSTRRFLVLCTFQPETLTVRAGINLPGAHKKQENDNINKVDNVEPDPEASNIVPYDTELESVNDVQVSKLERHQHLVDARNDDHLQDESAVQLVLMVILIASTIIGCVVAVWWFLPNIKKQLPAQMITDDSSSISSYENFENSIRESTASECDGNIPVLNLGTNQNEFESMTSEDTMTESECANLHVNMEENGDDVFTIHITSPPATNNTCSSNRPCITIEQASHSEA